MTHRRRDRFRCDQCREDTWHRQVYDDELPAAWVEEIEKRRREQPGAHVSGYQCRRCGEGVIRAEGWVRR